MTVTTHAMTEKITREEIEALLKLAEAATPGPWKQHLVDDTTVICPQREICCTFAEGGLNDDLDFNSDTEQFEADAAFIAAANPAVIKALCTLALQAEAMREALIETAASLSAAHSLLSRGGKRAAPSNKMFAVMLEDYRKSLDRAVATLFSLPESRR